MSLLSDLYKRFKPVASFVASPLQGTKYQSSIDEFQDRLKNIGSDIIERGKVSNRGELEGNRKVREAFQRYFQPTENVRFRDVVRELPGAAKQVGSDILRSTPRATVALTQATNRPDQTFTPTSRFEKLVLGSEPIRPTKSNVPQEFFVNKGVDPRLATLASSGLAIGGIAADIFSGGLAKEAKLLAKTVDEGVIASRLAKAGIKDANIIKQVAKETNPAKVEEILKGATKGTKPTGKYSDNPTEDKAIHDIIYGSGGFNADEYQASLKEARDIFKRNGQDSLLKRFNDSITNLSPREQMDAADKVVMAYRNKGGALFENIFGSKKVVRAEQIKSITPELPPKPTTVAPEVPPTNQLKRSELTGKALSTPESKLRTPVQTPQTPSTSTFEDIISKSTPVREKINVLDYVRTPENVLNKIGLGSEAKAIRSGWEAYLRELPDEIGKIDVWKSQITPEGNTKIFQYLDGRLNIASLDPTEQKVAGEIKDYLKQWADRLKLPEEKRISNYITHIFDQDLIQKEFPDEIANIISDKVAGSVYDPFTQQRLGKLGYKEDTFAALEAYVKRGTRKVNMDPALEQVKNASKSLEQSQFNYVKQYIDRINMRPTQIDNLVDNTIKSIFGYKAGVRPLANLSRKARQVIYRGTLGLNVSSALKNLSQGANTYAKLGEKYTVKGYYDLFKNYGSDELVKVGVLADDFIQDRTLSTYRKAAQQADGVLFSLFQTAEKINRGAAYYGAKAKAIAGGLDEASAIEYAKKIVRETQFTFGAIDTPPILQSDIGKTLGQFQSFTLKQGEFLGGLITQKDWAGIARWIGASLLFVYGVGKLFGMEPKDIIPTVRIGAPPALSLPIDLVKLALGGTDKYGNPLTLGGVLKKDLPAVVPAGVQIKKTYEGLKAANQGYSETDKGKIRFPVESNTLNKIKGGLFGQYTFPEAREYFDKEYTPLSDKQSEKIKLLPQDSRKEAIEGIRLRQENERQQEQTKEDLKKEQKGKAQAADVDRYAFAYGYEEVGDSPSTTAKKLIKEKDIPANIKDELAERLGIKKEVDFELAKEAFGKSDKNFQQYEDFVFRRDKDGGVSTMRKVDYDYNVNENALQSAKRAGNYKGWLSIAKKQYKLLISQLSDPTLDELDRSDILEKIDILNEKVEKYEEYGGFKKGKKPKKLPQIASKLPLSNPSNPFRPLKINLPQAPSIPISAQRIGFQGGSSGPLSNPFRPNYGVRIQGRPRNLL